MRDLPTLLLLLLVAAVVRAAGRLLAARALRPRPASVHLGVGPVILRRTGADGVAWTVGLVPLPLVGLGPTARAGRAALALSGPVAGYLAGALVVAATRMTHGEDHETNVVEAVEAGPATEALDVTGERRGVDPLAPRGLRAGDRIVAAFDRPTPDGESVRRFTTWIDGDDNSLSLTVLRDGDARLFHVVFARHEIPNGLTPSPALGVALRVDRQRVGFLSALGGGLSFPAAKGSAIRWLAEAVAPRVRLQMREDPISYLPSRRRGSWPLRLADALGLFALISLLPWPGLDGGELLLVTWRAGRGKPPPPWFEGLLRSRGWGAGMALAVALVTLGAPSRVRAALFGREPPPAARALTHWAG